MADVIMSRCPPTHTTSKIRKHLYKTRPLTSQLNDSFEITPVTARIRKSIRNSSRIQAANRPYVPSRRLETHHYNEENSSINVGEIGFIASPNLKVVLSDSGNDDTFISSSSLSDRCSSSSSDSIDSCVNSASSDNGISGNDLLNYGFTERDNICKDKVKCISTEANRLDISFSVTRGQQNTNYFSCQNNNAKLQHSSSSLDAEDLSISCENISLSDASEQYSGDASADFYNSSGFFTEKHKNMNRSVYHSALSLDASELSLSVDNMSVSRSYMCDTSADFYNSSGFFEEMQNNRYKSQPSTISLKTSMNSKSNESTRAESLSYVNKHHDITQNSDKTDFFDFLVHGSADVSLEPPMQKKIRVLDDFFFISADLQICAPNYFYLADACHLWGLLSVFGPFFGQKLKIDDRFLLDIINFFFQNPVNFVQNTPNP